MKLLHLLFISACTVPLLASASEPCFNFDDDSVILSGKVIERTFYGPPNYGESPKTDSRETQLLLLLSKPICVNENPSAYEEAEKNQLQVTLVSLGKLKITPYLGKKISVKGKLFHSENGHHHTPVLIEVISIEKTGS